MPTSIVRDAPNAARAAVSASDAAPSATNSRRVIDRRNDPAASAVPFRSPVPLRDVNRGVREPQPVLQRSER